MDLSVFVNQIAMPCCVMSVEKTEEGKCGEIRIVTANARYKEVMGPAYYDGMPYQELVPQDNKFEDYCFRAAILKQRMHAYVETRALNCWTDQTLIPLEGGNESLGYCQFIFEFTQAAEPDRMATVSINTAETVIAACMRLMGAEHFRDSVGDVLDVMIKEAGARAARIMLVDHEKKRAVNYCDRIADDSWKRLEGEMESAISYDLIRSWEAMIGVSNAVIICDEKDMALVEEKNPAWAKSMRNYRIRSLVLIPLRRDKAVIGYMYVLNFDTSKVVEVKEMMELMSFVLGSEIYNHLLLRRLEEMSQVDVLTGIQNRRAMSRRTKEIDSSADRQPYGVVNIDLNGLKFVNDEEGHEAGDRLLIQAAEVLRKVFYEDDIFRTGGDEFIIITSDISMETFDRKVNRLRSDAEKHGVCLAVGSCWCDGNEELTKVFRLADERMYADKKRYYEQHPQLRRS